MENARRLMEQEHEIDGLRAALDSHVSESTRLRAELAKVTAERDDLRDRLLCACSYGVGEHGENERDIARLLGIPRHELPALLADALNVNWVCRERATPADGD